MPAIIITGCSAIRGIKIEGDVSFVYKELKKKKNIHHAVKHTYQRSIHSLKAVEGKYHNRSTAEPGSLSVGGDVRRQPNCFNSPLDSQMNNVFSTSKRHQPAMNSLYNACLPPDR